MEEVKLFIPTVGRGSRVNKYTKFINKCLIPYRGKPVIHHIIKKFPTELKIVIALGYKGNLVKEFCDIAFPNRNVTYVDLGKDEHLKEDSGPSKTLLCCQEFLEDAPFIFWSCDTLVKFPRDLIQKQGWGGVSTKHKNEGRYRKVKNSDFVGIGKIDNPKHFFEGLKKLSGYKDIFEFKNHSFDEVFDFKNSWVDMGHPSNIENDDIWEKYNEQTWRINNKFIKLFDNQKRTNNFITSSKFIPNSPKILNNNKSFICYLSEKGYPLSEFVTEKIFSDLLGFLQNKLWFVENGRNYIDSYKFYFVKTQKRISDYLSVNKDYETINDIEIPSIDSLVGLIPTTICKHKNINIHGDLHFDNIIYNQEKEKFSLIDWRPEVNGDIYYDLGKLLHGLFISHHTEFSTRTEEDRAYFDINIPYSYFKCRDMLYNFVENNALDLEKLELINSIIFLNMAPLHKKPLSNLCFLLGKELLYKCLTR